MTTKEIIEQCQKFMAQKSQKSINYLYMLYAQQELNLSKKKAEKYAIELKRKNDDEKHQQSDDCIKFYWWLYFNDVQFSLDDLIDSDETFIEVAEFIFSYMNENGISNEKTVINHIYAQTGGTGDLFTLARKWTSKFAGLSKKAIKAYGSRHICDAIYKFCAKQNRQLA